MTTTAERVLSSLSSVGTTPVLADWWSELSKDGKRDYLKEHPDSKYAGQMGGDEQPQEPQDPKAQKPKQKPKKAKAPKEDQDSDDGEGLRTSDQIDWKQYKTVKTGEPTPITPEGKKLRKHLKQLQDHIDKLEPQYHAEKDPRKKDQLGKELDKAGDEAHSLMTQNWGLIHPGERLEKRGIVERLGNAVADELNTIGDAAKAWFTGGGASAGSQSRTDAKNTAKKLKPKIKDKIKGGASWPSLKGILKGLKSGSVKSTKSVGKAVGTALALSLLGAGAPVAIGAIAYLVGRDFLKFAKKKVGAATEFDPGPALDTPRVDALGDQEDDADLDALLDQLIDAIGDAELTDEQLQEAIKLVAQMEQEPQDAPSTEASGEAASRILSASAGEDMPYPKVTFRDVNFWSTFAEDSLDEAYLDGQASWETCSKGTQIVFQGKVWAEWDRATNSGWAYNLKKDKPLAVRHIDDLVHQLDVAETEMYLMKTAGKKSATKVWEDRAVKLRSEIYQEIAKVPQPDLQKVAVRYQYLFAPEGPVDTNPELQRYHKGLGTYWEPYAAPFGFDTGE